MYTDCFTTYWKQHASDPVNFKFPYGRAATRMNHVSSKNPGFDLNMRQSLTGSDSIGIFFLGSGMSYRDFPVRESRRPRP